MESSSSSSSSSSSFMKTCEENSRLSSPGALQRSCLFSSFSPAFERRGETPRLLTSSMEAAQTEETTMKEEEEKREGLSPSSCSSSGQCVSGTPSMNKPSVSLREKMKSRMKFLCSLSSFFSHLRQGVHTLGDWVHCTYTRIWMKSVLPLQLYLANHHCLLIYCLLFVGRLVEFTFHFTACLVPAFFYVYFSMFLHLLSSPSPSSPQEIPRDSQLALRRSQRIHIDASSHREREEEARLSRSSRVVFERFSRGQGEGNSSSFGGGGEEGERRGGSSFFFSSEEDFIDASIPSSSTATSGEKWIFLSLTSLYIILSHAFHGLLVEVPLYTFALYFSQLLHLQSLSFSLSPKCRLEFSSSSSSSAYPSSSYAARSTTTTSETGDENGRDTPFFSSSSSSSDRIVTSSSSSSSSFSPLSVVMEEREGEDEEEEEEEEESSLLISPSVVGRDADHPPCEEEAGGDEREKEKKGVSCSVDLHASENEAPKSLLSLSSETTMKREEEDEEKKKDKKREDGGAVDKERSCTEEEEEERIEQEGEEVSKERGEVGYLKKKRQDDRKSLSSCLPSNSARSSSSPSSAFLSPRLDVVDRKDDANASGDVISSSFSLSSSSSSVFQDEGVRLRHRGRRREEDKDEEIEESDPSLGCHSLSSSLPVGLLLSSRKRRERREKEKEEEKPEKTPPERNGASLERIGTCHVSSFFPLPSPLRLQAAFPSREKKDQEEFVSSTEMCDLRQEASRAFSSSSTSSRSRRGINSSSAPPALSPLSQTDRRERRDSFSEQCISMTACSSGYQDAAEEDRRGEDEGEQDENEEGGDLFFAKMKIRGLSLLFFIHSAALFLLSKLTSMVSSSPSSSPPSSSSPSPSSSSHDSRSATSFLLSLFSRRRMSEETRRRRERDDGGRSDSSLSFFFLHLLSSCTQHLFTFVSFLSSFFSFCGCFISSQLSRFLSFLRGLFIFFLITLPSSKGRHLFSNVKAGLRDIFSFLSLHRGLFIHRCPFFKRERWERRWRRLRHSLHPFRLLSISPLFLFPNASHRLFFLTFFFWLIRSLHFHSYYSSLRQGGEDEDLVTFLRETEEEMGGNRFLLHVASQGGEGVVEEESLRQLLSAEVGGEGGDEGLLISSQLFAFPEVDEEEEEEEEGEKKNEEGKKRRRMRRQLTSMLEKKKKMKASAIDNNDEESQGGIESRGDPRKEEEKKKKKSGEEEGLNRIEDEEEFIVSSSDQIDQSSSSSTRRRSDMRLSHSSSSSVDEGKKDMKKSQTENGVLPEEEEDEREEENARDRKEKENEETLIKKKKKKKKKDLHDDHSSWSISRLLSTCFSHNFSSSSPAPRLSPSTPSPSSSSSFPFSLFPFFFRDPHDHLASPFTRRLLLHLHQQHGAPPSLSPSPHLLSSSSSSARGKIEETIMTWGAVLLFLLVLSYFLLGILSSLGLLPFQLLHTLLILRYTHVTTYSRFREEETKRRRREKEEEEKKKEDERRRNKSRRTRDKEEDVFSRSQGEGVACLEETGKEGGRCGQSVAERKIEKEEMERMATSHDKEKEEEEGINEEEEEICGREGMKKLLDQEEESEGERREELSSSHPADIIQEEDEEDEDMCIFCFEEFQPLDILRVVTPCRHKFHRECIDAWFFKRERDTCPMCGPIQIRSTTSYNIPP